MARNGVNKVILVGNLGQAPEIRYLPNGTAVATFSIATSETWKDRETDELKEQTEWHRLVCYRKLAEISEKYLSKGTKIYVEGRLRTRKWKDNAGNDRSTTEIQADDLRILDSRRGAMDNASSGEAQNFERSESEKRSSKDSKPSSPPSNFVDLENMEFDDDIPF